MSVNTASTPSATDTGSPLAGGRAMTLSDSAARRIRKIADKEGAATARLRLSVSGGGCSGFQYNFDMGGEVNDDDHVFRNGEVELVVDDVSLDLVAGATLNFVDDLMGQYFRVDNPNASSSCGCGTSFAI